MQEEPSFFDFFSLKSDKPQPCTWILTLNEWVCQNKNNVFFLHRLQGRVICRWSTASNDGQPQLVAISLLK